jgi:asparagine synthase (glutamine-hydrolysing)
MPGLAGLVTRMPKQRAQRKLREMLAVMHHESFYLTRMWADEELGLYVGWTALEGSFSDAGPHQSEAGDTVLIFCGEEFSEADATQPQGRDGYKRAYAHLVHQHETDSTFPAGLNGLFHGVVADRRRQKVTLFNDRYGMHRLYVHESRDAVYFAAEAKAILAVCPELRKIDQQSLGESITLGCVLENRTLFDGIRVMPGGSLWTFEDGRVHARSTYFEPSQWEQQPRLDDEEFYETLRSVFWRNLPRYFDGPQRIGMSLTGGLDTRMIMAWQRCPPGSLPCYTWGGTYRDCQDVVVARAVARACRQFSEVIPVGREFLSRFPYYADRAIFLTDGCVDVSAAADVYMNERARAIAPVRMTGLYGGEVLRRVRSFKPAMPLPGLFQPELVPQFQLAQKTYETALEGHPLSFGVFRQAPWHHYGNLTLEQSQVTVRSPFLDNELVRTVFRAPESACASNAVSMRLIADGNPALGRIPTDRGLGGTGILPERASHALQEFLFKAEYAYDYGMPQWLARLDHVLAPLGLERLFLGRHKALHFRVWYRGALSSYVREMLLDPRSLARPYVERKTLERIVTAHTRGHGNYTTEIHKMLKLELLHRAFIDDSLTTARFPDHEKDATPAFSPAAESLPLMKPSLRNCYVPIR